MTYGTYDSAPTTEDEYKARVNAKIQANGRRQPDNGIEEISIQLDLRNLTELNNKTLEWLISNATERPEYLVGQEQEHNVGTVGPTRAQFSPRRRSQHRPRGVTGLALLVHTS